MNFFKYFNKWETQLSSMYKKTVAYSKYPNIVNASEHESESHSVVSDSVTP